MALQDTPLFESFEIDINEAGEALLIVSQPVAASRPDGFSMKPTQVLLYHSGRVIARIGTVPEDYAITLAELDTLLLCELPEDEAAATEPRLTDIPRL